MKFKSPVVISHWCEVGRLARSESAVCLKSQKAGAFALWISFIIDIPGFGGVSDVGVGSHGW